MEVDGELWEMVSMGFRATDPCGGFWIAKWLDRGLMGVVVGCIHAQATD